MSLRKRTSALEALTQKQDAQVAALAARIATLEQAAQRSTEPVPVQIGPDSTVFLTFNSTLAAAFAAIVALGSESSQRVLEDWFDVIGAGA